MFGFGDKNKVHKVTIANTGETFEVEGKINLLQAAVNAGIKCIGFPGDYHLEDNFQMCIKKMN